MSTIRGYYELTRLHSGIGLFGCTLLFWPCAWALTIAAKLGVLPLSVFLEQIIPFAVGCVLMNSLACVWNDTCDVEFDRQVERTRSRPLPAGKISMLGAYVLCVLLLAPILYLLSFTAPLAIMTGLFGLFPLHTLYPLMKRWTWWPQGWLGLAYNWGVPLAWVTATGTLPPFEIWVLFFGGVCWTLVYDTIYGCQDRADDRRIGLKSTSLLFGEHIRPILCCFSGIFMLCLAYSGWSLSPGVGHTVVSCGGALLHLVWQMKTWRENDPNDHKAKFMSNGVLGAIVWLGLMYDYLVALDVVQQL